MFPAIGLLLTFCSLSVYFRQDCPIGMDQCYLTPSHNVTAAKALEFCTDLFDESLPKEGNISYHSYLDCHPNEDKEWRITVNRGYIIELTLITIQVFHPCLYFLKAFWKLGIGNIFLSLFPKLNKVM